MSTSAWETVAKAPRKSWLGKVKRLTPMQERWVKAILGVWADEFGGAYYTGGNDGCGIWRFVSGWSAEESDKFTKVLEGLRKIGYQGQELLIKAQAIIWPKRTISDMLNRANDEDEADFVEKAILKAWSKDNPVYVIACKYYVDRNTVQELANYMQYQVAPWLTNKQCADRVRWCISLFDAKVYFVLHEEMDKEKAAREVEQKNIFEFT
ncbi:hypothetical protein [Pantoea sp. BAV 3049]|uniref:hypothetical protein n=1 Tax=Pantoea sp. BAV 3049 TaxID=2654188 RepID=UPI00131D0A2F|nr:hypothetical protein [Pantoea sp. BAV 3049]